MLGPESHGQRISQQMQRMSAMLLLGLFLMCLAKQATAQFTIILGSGVSVVHRQSAGTLDAFKCDFLSGFVYHASSLDWVWSPIARNCNSQPSAISLRADHLAVFFRSTDFSLSMMEQSSATNGAWGPVVNLGGALSGSPSVASALDGLYDVAVTGLNDNLLWLGHGGGSTAWTWTPVGGLAMGGDPGIMSPALSKLHVFARGTDGGLWHISATYAYVVDPNGYFSFTPQLMWDKAWEGLGGGIAPGCIPSAVVAPGGYMGDLTAPIQVFVTGTDRAVWSKTSMPPNGWGPWSSFGGVVTSSPAAVAWSAPGSYVPLVDVFAAGSDTRLWHFGYNGVTWSNWWLALAINMPTS